MEIFMFEGFGLQQILSEQYGMEMLQESLLVQSITHKSYANENGTKDNERLEYLGDAILNTIVSIELFYRYPEKSEGQLSKMRAHLINEKSLHQKALDLKINEEIRLGKGEMKSFASENARLLASAFEALCAAIYLDLGFVVLTQFIRQVFEEDIVKIQNFEMHDQDYKTQFQEVIQKKHQTTPSYQMKQIEGGQFEVDLFVLGELFTQGHGKNRKMAEQDAAKKALMKVGL